MLSRRTNRRRARAELAILAGAFLAGARAVAAQAPEAVPACADSVATRVESAWRAYRDDRIREAGDAFRAALACQPHSLDARVGSGYVALRGSDERRAAERFQSVLRAVPHNVDALVGLGLIAWRDGDVEGARAYAARALELDPERQDAAELRARTLAALPRPTGPAERPPLFLPDTLVYPSRTIGRGFEVRTASGWQPFYWKGVNLGAALPGKHPSEFPDEATYAGWIAEMTRMGANVVRVYTIHPPDFYRALERHNLANPDSPLWLVHGVWTELPPGDDYADPVWEAAFFGEMRRVVDLIHGRADLDERPGHASGTYRADVSPWVLAYIIGREWEPFSVIAFNRMRPELDRWDGRYLSLEAGTPMDVWLAKACEEIVAYESETYRAQRPVAYTNWPTLDPLHHPTEPTVAEELAIREALGEEVHRIPREYDNDGAHLDAAGVRPSAAYPAGYFASFHAYPYYPDFMGLDPAYGRAESPFGPSNYFGYLEALARAHPDLPVVISEYGVPASLGIAHLGPQGRHHGGHTERAMAEIDARLTEEIAAAGMAGGVLFAWIDEWFKKNWLTIDFEIPLDRNRLWLNRLDAEQHYGVLAMEPGSGPAGVPEAERAGWWQSRVPLYSGPDGSSLRAAADEAYLWLRFEGPLVDGRRRLPERLSVGFDTVDPSGGDQRWPGREGEPMASGLEYALQIEPGADGTWEGRMLVDPASNPFRLVPVRSGLPGPEPLASPVAEPGRPASAPDGSSSVARPPPREIFAARREQTFNRPVRTVANDDGVYDSLRVITNRSRFARDGTEYLATGYDRGILPAGPAPDGLWLRDEESGTIEVRIPWGLLGVTDPSERRVLQDLPDGVSPTEIGAQAASGSGPSAGGGFGTVTVPDIGIAARWSGTHGAAVEWPGSTGHAARFAWETWEAPRWTSRTRPAFEAMRHAFARLRPRVLAGDAFGLPEGVGR